MGYDPFAVSPDNMTQSAPSSTALATSLTSARVGRGLYCTKVGEQLKKGIIKTYRHGFQHLGGTDDRLANHIALRDHHLLGKEDLASRDLNTQITTRNHHTIRGFQDLVKVRNALLVLNLHDDLDISAVRAEDFTDVEHILCAPDKRREDHVDSILDAEQQVGLVLLGERGKVDVGLGKVDTLAGRENAVVEASDSDVGAIDGEDEERKNAWDSSASKNKQNDHMARTIVDVDELSGCSDLRQVFLKRQTVSDGPDIVHHEPNTYVVHEKHLVVARLGILVVGGNNELVSSFHRDLAKTVKHRTGKETRERVHPRYSS